MGQFGWNERSGAEALRSKPEQHLAKQGHHHSDRREELLLPGIAPRRWWRRQRLGGLASARFHQYSRRGRSDLVVVYQGLRQYHAERADHHHAPGEYHRSGWHQYHSQ